VRQSNAQIQLIDDLLDVSRITTGKMRLQVRAVDLARVIAEAVEALGPDQADLIPSRTSRGHGGPIR